MSKTIALVGARGGHGTTTVAAIVALHAARTGPTTLVSDPSPAATLLGVPVGDSHASAPVDVTTDLQLVAARPQDDVDRIVVVDEGTLTSTPATAHFAADERYLVLRGPCYIALATAMAAGVDGMDGIILVAEPRRSLTAADVTDVLGLPVVATVTVSHQVARSIDAGLLPARFTRLRDLSALRALGTPTATSAPPPRSTPRHVTDLPLSLCDNGAERDSCPDRVAILTARPPVGRVWKLATGRSSAEHRPPRSRSGRLLRRRGGHLSRGLLLGSW